MKLRSIAIAGALAITGVAASTAAPAAADTSAVIRCVVVYDFPDAGLKYCYDPQGPCLVTEHRTTFLGSESRCVVPNPVY